MTQNVKKCRAPSPTRRSFAVLLLLALGALATLACSEDKPKTPATGTEAGAPGCTGDDCQTPAGRFTPCSEQAECDEAHGFSCVDGECSYECRSHADCVQVGHCGSTVVDGTPRNFCVRDAEPPQPGALYTACPNGTECADPVLCLGAGAGDLDAYCTIDCSTDDDCAAGYSCGVMVRNPCADACDTEGVPSDARCVPGDQIGAGKPFHCGEQGVERKVCRQREFCAPCTSDADCLAVPNQVCAKDESGEKICTRVCDTETRSCPWGNATQCDYYDDELGLPTCSHRFGSCHGTGKTCQPCRSNADCPGGGCASSQFTGERWCINLSTKCACKNGVDASGRCTDGGCPDSPGGLAIQCIGDDTSALFNICYGASAQLDLGSSPQTGCWAAP